MKRAKQPISSDPRFVGEALGAVARLAWRVDWAGVRLDRAVAREVDLGTSPPGCRYTPEV